MKDNGKKSPMKNTRPTGKLPTKPAKKKKS